MRLIFHFSNLIMLLLVLRTFGKLIVKTQAAGVQEASDSYLNQAKRLFDTGMEAHQQAQTYSSLLPNEDPRAARMLRDSIGLATGSFGSHNNRSSCSKFKNTYLFLSTF